MYTHSCQTKILNYQKHNHNVFEVMDGNIAFSFEVVHCGGVLDTHNNGVCSVACAPLLIRPYLLNVALFLADLLLIQWVDYGKYFWRR